VPKGIVRAFKIAAKPIDVDLGGRSVRTWAYGSTIPGSGLRATAGDRVQIEVTNRLPVSTSVHWHGLAIPNGMDGVPGVTTPELPPGASYTYDFVVPDSGTHWFHPHSGLQLDTGLYAPFIIDDPAEPGAYDAEWVVVLDDWTDGWGRSPDQLFAELGASADTAGSDGIGMDGMGMDGMGMDGGDVQYPAYLINGRTLTDPETFTGKAGDRVRIRVINAAADSIFTVALSSHQMQVTHSDGYAVTPQLATSVRVGMGERYDLLVTLQDGAFSFVAQPLGKEGYAAAFVRTSSGTAPPSPGAVVELTGEPLTVVSLEGIGESALPRKDPDSVQDVVLNGSMAPYRWTINGEGYADMTPLTIRSGQTGRLRFRNMTMMSHPMHLHGHSFQLGAAGGLGPRKDTVLVPPMGAVDVDFAADNPGLWMLHCHNAYHAEAGMMTRLDYVS
jgi:FtsP/CotA-like multicopper oxidase with cupredoxin domain